MARPAQRILFHIPLLSVGGAERNLLDLAVRLGRERFEPVVWCSENGGPIARELESAGVAVFKHPLDFGDAGRAQQAVELLTHLHPAVFHSMSYRRNCSDVLAAVFADIPVIITTRQSMRHWDPRRTVQDWEQIRNRIADVVIANAAAVAAECLEVERLHPRKIRVIRNGICVPPEVRRGGVLRGRLGLPADILLAGNVGNLRPQKGHDVLLRAWSEVAKQAPHAHLIICGEDYGLLHDLEALAKSLAIQTSVSFPGAFEHMEQVYSDLDLYIQSSRTEGLSTAVLEAMSLGCPVVATDAGGTREAVLDGVTGLLVPVEEPGSLARAILRLLRDPELCREFGKAGRQRVSAEFCISRVVQEHESLYAELLESAGDHRGGLNAISGV